MGLKWRDVDWDKSQIHIRRSFNNQAWYAPKSKSSIRKIDLGPSTLTALKRWRLQCPVLELDLIFPNETGKPLNHNNMINRYFVPALKAANLGKVRSAEPSSGQVIYGFLQSRTCRFFRSSALRSMSSYAFPSRPQGLHLLNQEFRMGF